MGETPLRSDVVMDSDCVDNEKESIHQLPIIISEQMRYGASGKLNKQTGADDLRRSYQTPVRSYTL